MRMLSQQWFLVDQLMDREAWRVAERLTNELIMHICVSARRAEQSRIAWTSCEDVGSDSGGMDVAWDAPTGVPIACQRITC